MKRIKPINKLVFEEFALDDIKEGEKGFSYLLVRPVDLSIPNVCITAGSPLAEGGSSFAEAPKPLPSVDLRPLFSAARSLLKGAASPRPPRPRVLRPILRYSVTSYNSPGKSLSGLHMCGSAEQGK